MFASALDVATNVGRPLSESETTQVEQWIRWAEATIARRMGNLNNLDYDTVSMVIVEAVTRRLRMPEPVSQVSVSVDDGNVNKTYTRATGLIEILPEWWAELGWVEPRPRTVFTVKPYGAPDVVPNAW